MSTDWILSAVHQYQDQEGYNIPEKVYKNSVCTEVEMTLPVGTISDPRLCCKSEKFSNRP
jgi:hypothetical protein